MESIISVRRTIEYTNTGLSSDTKSVRFLSDCGVANRWSYTTKYGPLSRGMIAKDTALIVGKMIYF